jgi:FMN phosphatase YigB (HAD superfamily)
MGYNQSMKLILLDIDNTILDTAFYASQAFERTQNLLEKKGWARPQEFEIKKSAYFASITDTANFFSPQSFADSLNLPNNLKKSLTQIWFDELLFKQSIYSDFLKNLSRFKKDSILGIFSQGDLNFQEKKLRLMGIYSNFEQKFILIKKNKVSPESLAELKNLIQIKTHLNQTTIEKSTQFVQADIENIAQPDQTEFEQVMLIDDRIDVVQFFENWPLFTTYLMDRKNQFSTQLDLPENLKVISSFDQVQI